jgi:host factor-I protein
MEHGGIFFWNESIESKEIGTMESKPAQNIQDTFLNTVRKDKSPITIYLVSGVKLTGKIRSFDKYSVLLENNSQEQLIFKHAISTVVSGRAGVHPEPRPEGKLVGAHPAATGMATHETLGSQGH